MGSSPSPIGWKDLGTSRAARLFVHELLLCGGDKGSQERDIERAKKYFQEYRSEHDEKEKK